MRWAFLLLFLAACGASEKEAPEAATQAQPVQVKPYHPWRNASPGDWAKYEHQIGEQTSILVYRVIEVSQDEVVYEVETQVDESNQTKRVRVDLNSEAEVGLDHLKSSNEKLVVNMKELLCRKTVVQGEPHPVETWTSADVTAGGLVKYQDGSRTTTLLDFGSQTNPNQEAKEQDNQQ